mgnify:FL=1|jgi:hypothetical protein|tara:strand:+ start:106 stop:1353 length:1248 start_codon:yes stop_codon:yes gene_type:complete
MKLITIEDCIEALAGTHEHIVCSKEIESSDKSLIYSLARQTVNGTAYTDRQHELAISKATHYKSILEEVDIDVTTSVTQLRMPLRSIDRSRWIKLKNIEQSLITFNKPEEQYIAVRFSFQKKLISALENINSKPIHYDKINKTHYFEYNERTLHNVVSALTNKGFEIQPELQERYEILEMMNNNKKNYVPGIYSLKLKNLHAKAIDYAISTIGSPDVDNLAMYKDRDQLLGITHFDEDDLNNSIRKLTTLSQKIVKRTSSNILINSDEHVFDRVAESILELNRYPLLVVLNDETELENLQKVHQSFRNIFSNDDFCSLYRKENISPGNTEFNEYIKQNKLNNSLAIKSKVVYTSINKMSKVMLKSEWRPQAAILMGSRRSTKVDQFLQELDLVIHYDTDVSPFRKFSSLQVIEKI